MRSPATGAGKIMRRFPLIGGIDVAGTVESSADTRVQARRSRASSPDTTWASTHDGGFSGYVRVPAEWVIPIPQGLTPFDTMAIGTAGFTAALSIVEMERNGLAPANGPVIVTGATGGVGSIAIQALAARGYAVTALTGKAQESDYLRVDRCEGDHRCAARSTWAQSRSRSRCGPARWIPWAATSSAG